jgi:hypothetical protein
MQAIAITLIPRSTVILVMATLQATRRGSQALVRAHIA